MVITRTPYPLARRYSAEELTSCQLLNDLTAATLRLGLLRRSGLTPHQLVHVRELARCLAVAVGTITAAHVDALEADVPTLRSSTHRPPQFFDVHLPNDGRNNHPAD